MATSPGRSAIQAEASGDDRDRNQKKDDPDHPGLIAWRVRAWSRLANWRAAATAACRDCALAIQSRRAHASRHRACPDRSGRHRYRHAPLQSRSAPARRTHRRHAAHPTDGYEQACRHSPPADPENRRPAPVHRTISVMRGINTRSSCASAASSVRRSRKRSKRRQSFSSAPRALASSSSAMNGTPRMTASRSAAAVSASRAALSPVLLSPPAQARPDVFESVDVGRRQTGRRILREALHAVTQFRRWPFRPRRPARGLRRTCGVSSLRLLSAVSAMPSDFTALSAADSRSETPGSARRGSARPQIRSLRDVHCNAAVNQGSRVANRTGA